MASHQRIARLHTVVGRAGQGVALPGVEGEGGEQMIRPVRHLIKGEVLPNLGTMLPTPAVDGYLHELAALALEVAAQRRLLPGTIASLLQAQRRLPA